MLDGTRLILKSGNYGQASSTYGTEIESFQGISANGSLGSGPESFTVTDQNGLTYQYGISSNGRVINSSQPEVLMWLLEEVTDIYGNSMHYNY